MINQTRIAKISCIFGQLDLLTLYWILTNIILYGGPLYTMLQVLSIILDKSYKKKCILKKKYIKVYINKRQQYHSTRCQVLNHTSFWFVSPSTHKLWFSAIFKTRSPRVPQQKINGWIEITESYHFLDRERPSLMSEWWEKQVTITRHISCIWITYILYVK